MNVYIWWRLYFQVIKELFVLMFFVACIFIGNQLGSTLMNDLQDQEKELKQFMLQLENVEAARDSLLSQLKDALLEQVQMFL